MPELHLEDEPQVGKESGPEVRKSVLCLKKGRHAGGGLAQRGPEGLEGSGGCGAGPWLVHAALCSGFGEFGFHWK